MRSRAAAAVDLRGGRHPARRRHRSRSGRAPGRAPSGCGGSRDSRATAAPPWRRHRTAPGTPARNAAEEPVVTTTRSRRNVDAVALADSAARCARAAPAARAPPCSPASRCSSARCTAASAARGAGVPGWPTSMWMTCAPCASRAAAACITSMTMKGGTALRRDGGRDRSACASSAAARSSAACVALPLPRALKPPWLRPTREPDGSAGDLRCREADWRGQRHAAYSRGGSSCLGWDCGLTADLRDQRADGWCATCSDIRLRPCQDQ